MVEPSRMTPGSRLPEVWSAVRGELARVVVGQDRAIQEVGAAFFAGGHVLLEGVPGVAKTLLAKALARTLELSFHRVQFTPDLMPTDVVGTNVWREDLRRFELSKGPVFTDVLLADEINRTPPKTQAALLEAMEERQVTIDGERHALGASFFVIATQNPLEHEGTYPLPEAQVDRFLIKVVLGYPGEAEEVEILRRHGAGFDPHDLSQLKTVVPAAELPALRAQVAQVRVDDTLLTYVARLCRATRASLRLRLGASPRAAVALLSLARSAAALRGAGFVTPDDIKAAALPVLRHRLLLRPEAEVEGLSVDDTIAQLLDEVPVPR